MESAKINPVAETGKRFLNKKSIASAWSAGLLGTLAAFTNIRLGSLQPEDIVLIFLLAVCIGKFLYRGGYFRIDASLASLSKSYIFLLIGLAALAALALRLRFFPLDGASLLKQPLLFSLSKLVQLTACICGFLWLANGATQQRRWLEAAMSAYWLAGIASSIYSMVSLILVSRLHLSVGPTSLLGAYYPDAADSVTRVRGFFNEGGPYGIYLVSVVMVGLLRRKIFHRRLGRVNFILLAVTFAQAQSKSALLLVMLLLLIFLASISSTRKKILYLCLSASLLGAVAIKVKLWDQLDAYYTAYETLEQRMTLLGNDANLVLGRVASAYIIPRMIKAHPFTGIGIGNYPLMRNDPQYLGKLPAILYQEDLPALGILGEACEIGIPATILLLVLLFAPFAVCRKYGPVLGLSALFQPLAHLLGAQITYFYPWFVSGCALGACMQIQQTLASSQSQPQMEAVVPANLKPDFLQE